jgi:hypothetical protein
VCSYALFRIKEEKVGQYSLLQVKTVDKENEKKRMKTHKTFICLVSVRMRYPPTDKNSGERKKPGHFSIEATLTNRKKKNKRVRRVILHRIEQRKKEKKNVIIVLSASNILLIDQGQKSDTSRVRTHSYFTPGTVEYFKKRWGSANGCPYPKKNKVSFTLN